jgi:tetratricopeptide (TPR) repeat protein
VTERVAVAAALKVLSFSLAFAAVPVMTPGAAAGEPRTIQASAGQMLKLAEEMVRRGEMDDAETILALLARDPDSNVRNEARFRHARLLLALKRYRDAALLLRRLLDEKPQATAARLELAGALQRLGDTGSALHELRAVQSAGLPPSVARLIDRYSAALRARRPSGASFEFAVAPDSNINRATRSDSLGTVLGDFHIADESKAKSGTGLSLTGQTFRRFALGDDSSLLLRVSGRGNLYRRGRFNDLAADLAIGPELSFGRDRLQLEVGATQRWFGQKPYLRSMRLAETFSHPLGSRALVRVSGSAAVVDNRLNDLQDGKSYLGQVEAERALTPTTGLAVRLSLDRQALRDPGYSTRGWRAGLTGWREIGRMTMTLSGEIGRLRADQRLRLFPSPRQDRSARLSLATSFRQLQYSGFAPVLRFSVERNRSSIAFYDYRRTRTEIGLARAF